MALATLSIDLVARLATLERDMGVAVRTVEKGAGGIVRSLGAIKTAVTAVIGGAVVAGMMGMVSANAAAIDSFNDLKDATGASIENISALDSVGRRTGTTYEDVSSILVKFNKVLNEAKPDNEAGRVFKAMGLDVEKLKAMDPAEALRVTAAAMQTFSRDGGLARATQVLFSKSVEQAAPFLKDLAEAGTLNAKVTTEQAEKVEAFNKQLKQLQTNADDVKRELVIGLIPALNSLLETYNKEGFAALFGFGKEFKRKSALADLASDVVHLDKRLKALRSDKEGGIASYLFGDSKFFGKPAELDQEIARVTAQLAAAKARFRNADAQAKYVPFEEGFVDTDRSKKLKVPGPPGPPSAAIAIQEKIVERLSAAYEAARDPLHKLTEEEKFALKTVLELADAKNKLTDVEKRRITGQLEQLLLTSQQAEASKREAATIAESAKIIGDAYEQEAKDIEAFRKKMAGRPGELDAALFGFGGEGDANRKRALTARLEERLNSGEVIAPDVLDRMVRGIGGVSQEFVKAKDLAGDFASVFESGFEKAILSGEKLGDVLGALGRDIVQIGLRTAITQPLGKWAGGYMASMFSSLLPSFDVGTDSVPYDMVAKIHKGERIVPAAQNRAGAMGTTIININALVGDVASRSDVVAGMQTVRAQILGQLGRSRGYGGAAA